MEMVGVVVSNRMYQSYERDSITRQPLFQSEKNQMFTEQYFAQTVGPKLFMVAAYVIDDEIRFVSKRLYRGSKKNAEKLSLHAMRGFDRSMSIQSNCNLIEIKNHKDFGVVYEYRLFGCHQYTAGAYLLRKDLLAETAERLGGDLLISMPSPDLVLVIKNLGEIQTDFAIWVAELQSRSRYGEWGTKNLFVFQKEKGILHRVLYDCVISNCE